MTKIYKKHDASDAYTVQAGDTLSSIAQAKGVSDWKALARYNFGTAERDEVVRALVETIGVKLTDQAGPHKNDPSKLPLTPDARLDTPKLRVPTPWTADLAPKKDHTVHLKRARPAAAVGFRALDRWFIPKKEKCEVKYVAHGLAACADKLDFMVFGSNYCECTDWSEGRGTWGKPEDLVDEPIYKKDISGAKRAEETTLADGGWTGEATTEKGMLSRKTGTASKRYVSVAFSPYTVVLRARKDGEADDAKALLLVKPFWPVFKETKAEHTPTLTEGGSIELKWTNAADVARGAVEVVDKGGRRVFFAVLEGDQLKSGERTFTWDKKYLGEIQNTHGEGAYLDDANSVDADGNANNENAPYVYKVRTSTEEPKKESLKIEWEVRETSRLAEGIVRVVDKNHKVVFERPLKKALVGKGEHAIDDWDGAYAEGIKNSKDGDALIAADMPYRVEVRAHTGPHEEKGLALASMHTEVRLHVAPGAVDADHFAFESRVTPASLILEPAPMVLGVAPTADTAYLQMKLAEFGFHPGPVTGSTNEHYERALREFKRSVPRHKTTTDYQRMAIDTAESGDLYDAIQHIRASDKRTVFGDIQGIRGNSDAPDLAHDAYKQSLKRVLDDVVVWVDDRQYNTAADAALDEQGNAFLSGNAPRERMGLLNYRGGMVVGDGKTTLDLAEIPRPWIPLQVTARLMSRDKHLSDDVDANPSTDDIDTMRAALGPVRFDWTVDELSYDLSAIDTGHANYNKSFVRTQRYVQWALAQNQAKHTRADTKREAVYTNCTEALGGARPSSAASYHTAVFSEGDLSLKPWKPKSIGDKECMATVAHDHLSSAQRKNTDLFEESIGRAGVFFRPSIIAGDGYRVRAEVRFEKFDGYEFPNLEALKARYPARPQAASPAMRVWRRSSFRAYSRWGSGGGNWGAGFINAFRAFYRAAHVYFVHEGGSANTLALTNVFDPSNNAHVTRFKEIVTRNVTKNSLKDKNKVTLHAEHLWPWADRNDFGWPDLTTVDLPQGDLNTWLDTICSATWRKFRAALLMAFVREAERKGYLRGHLFLEFKASPTYYVAQYKCNGTTVHTYWGLKKATSNGPKHNTNCPSPGCTTTTAAAGKITDCGYLTFSAMSLPAVGGALGATWLFYEGEAEDRLKSVWAHEVGHHRHLEHAGDGPGQKDNLHDTAANEKVSNLTWSGLGGNAEPKAKRWDRRCIMSYSDCRYGELGYFCGVCVLRNRGWRVTGLGGPGNKFAHP